jgi:hypothetical protein
MAGLINISIGITVTTHTKKISSFWVGGTELIAHSHNWKHSEVSQDTENQ